MVINLEDMVLSGRPVGVEVWDIVLRTGRCGSKLDSRNEWKPLHT